MGKKKSFIDKSRAQTYSLIYRTAEEAAADPQGPDRIFVPTNDPLNVATGPSRPQPPFHPLAFREHSEPQLTDEQRREIIELGLPDDGYNYLKHMRTLAAPVKASIELPTGSDDQTGSQKLDLELEEKVAVVENDAFVPPPEDKAVTDASKLTVFSLAENDEAAFQHYGGVTTLSKLVDRVRGQGMAELAELESRMAEVENADDGEEGDDLGDWLDSFVVVATQPEEHPEEADADDNGGDDSSAGDVDSDFQPDDIGEEGDLVSELPGRRRVLNVLDDGRSVVSTVYSRSERHDRSETQSQIDERFEALAVEYDDSDIGSLEDDEEHTRGAADASSFHRHLEEFRAKHLLKNGLPRATFAAQLDELRQDGSCTVDDEAIAKARTKALAATLADAGPSRSRQRDEDLVQVVTSAPREQWDCESVISLRSNLNNHPGVIGHGKPLSKRRTAPAAASVVSDTPQALELSQKTGLPLGFASTGGRVHKEEAEEASCSAHAAAAAPTSAASSHSQARVRGETKEEKAARKAAVKDAKREARLNKKQLKNMYRTETVRQLKQASASGSASTIPIA